MINNDDEDEVLCTIEHGAEKLFLLVLKGFGQ